MNKIEKELEDWMFDNPDAFEKDIKWLKRQRKVSWHGQAIGKTDLVGITPDKTMVIVELKANVLTSHVIGQMLGYYRCLSTHEGCQKYRICFVGQKMSTVFRITTEWLNKITGIPVEVKLWKKPEGYILEDYNPLTHAHLTLEKEI